MNTLRHREDDDLDERRGGQDREIHLGTTLILGIFFALAVLCAVFFGLGYSTGRKSASVSTVVASEGQSSGGLHLKPTAGSAVGDPEKQSLPTPSTASYGTPAALPKAAVPAAQAADPDGMVVGDSGPAERPSSGATAMVRPVAAAALATPTPVIYGSGTAMVQIAAVSHQEDADLLVTTLKRRGYSVAVHSEPQDRLLHVQVGPFASHKDADLMRQRLLADGFNAIVKEAR